LCIYCGTAKYRKIYENHYGIIPKDEDGRSYEIHHIDGNHSNNDPTNLKCVTIQEHFDIHYLQKDYGACFLIARKMNLSVNEISELCSLFQNQRVECGTHPWLKKNGGGINARDRALQKVKDGTHPWLGGEVSRRTNARRVLEGTHHLLGGLVNKRRVENGTHPWLKKNGGSERVRKLQNQKVEDGTHHFLGPTMNDTMLADGRHSSLREDSKVKMSIKQQERVENGTHHFLGGEIQSKSNQERLDNGTHHCLRENDERISNGTHHFFGGEIQRKVNNQRVTAGTHNRVGNNNLNRQKVTCPHCNSIGGSLNMKRYHFDNCKKK